MKTNKKSIIAILFAGLLLLCCQIVCMAQDVTVASEYLANIVSDFPEVLNVGSVMDCGNFEVKIMGQPVVTKSSNSLIADLDMKFLIVRIGITNLTEQNENWLTPATFTAQETYLGHAYGTYKLDYIMSAKAASGFNLPAFFADIEPGKTLSTVLVFEVFPEAENWIISFNPTQFPDETASRCVEFMLPKALKQ